MGAAVKLSVVLIGGAGTLPVPERLWTRSSRSFSREFPAEAWGPLNTSRLFPDLPFFAEPSPGLILLSEARLRSDGGLCSTLPTEMLFWAKLMFVIYLVAQLVLLETATLGAVSEMQFKERKKTSSLSAWPCPRGKWHKWKRNVVIKFPGTLRSSGHRGTGRLCQARAPQSRRNPEWVVDPEFPRLLCRVPLWGGGLVPAWCTECWAWAPAGKGLKERCWCFLVSSPVCLSPFKFLKALTCYHAPITIVFPFFFSLVSSFQLYEPDWSLLSSCAGHNFIINIEFLKIPAADVCLSLLVQSFWCAADFSLGFILPFPGGSSVSSLLISHGRVSFQVYPDEVYIYTFLFMLITPLHPPT